MRRVTGTAALLALSCAMVGPAYGGAGIDLPAPAAARAQELALVCNRAVGATPERCKASRVPGPVVNDEVVLVGLDATGTPSQVLLEQRLVLTKVGDYVIRERGPARSAVGLVAGSDPPNTKLGAVVFQGFTPGDRKLGARLTLDAGLEAARLPLAVSLSFEPAGAASGAARPLQPGGLLPSAGTVHIRLANTTSQPAVLPTGSDASPSALALPLDAALHAARAAPGPRLPSTDTVLPKHLDVSGPAQRPATQSVPLRVTGTIRVGGTTGTVSGPGTSPLPDGAVVAGTLDAAGVDFTATVSGPGRLLLALAVVPTLDARVLAPPRGLPTWAAWARSGPPLVERQAALDLLVATAATGARASSYSPYLGADLPGTGTTVFRYSFAPPQQGPVSRPVLHPRPGPIAVTLTGLLLLLGLGVAVWRRS